MSTQPAPEGDHPTPVIPPALLTPDEVDDLFAMINKRLVEAAPWRCPTCIPHITVTAHAKDWTEHITHSQGCTTFAMRL